VTPTPRRRRVAAAAGLAAFAVLVAGGCTPGDAEAAQASKVSNERPSSSELDPSPQDDPFDPDLTMPDLSIPELSIPDSMPDADRIDECFELSAVYSQILVLAFGGDDQDQLPGLFDQLEAVAPDDVQDDLATMEDIVTEAAAGGLIDATGALLGDEFNEANAAIIEWLTEYCGGGPSTLQPDGEGA
jgi:hypothetical protein